MECLVTLKEAFWAWAFCCRPAKIGINWSAFWRHRN